MGRTKIIAESENNLSQAGSNNQSRQRRRRTTAPGRFFDIPLEAQPISVLLRLIWLRIRRTWVAFCFQANRRTLGIFKKQTSLKLGTVILVGYALLTANQEFWIFSQRPDFDGGSGKPVETAIELFGEKPEKPVRKAKKLEKDNSRNPNAPVGATELRDRQSGSYIDRFGPIAIQEMKKFGIPASISLAQGLVESRSGSSKLAVQNNNHFGIKCFSKNCKPGHCSNYSDDHHKDFFRKFGNPWESWRAHSAMLANGRYARLKKFGRDYRKWAYGLQQLGYATDRSYADKLIGVIEKFDLHRFDR